MQDLPHSEPVPPLSQLGGPFQLAEYLALKVKADPHDVKALVEVPKGDNNTGGNAPEKNVVRHIPLSKVAMADNSGYTNT